MRLRVGDVGLRRGLERAVLLLSSIAPGKRRSLCDKAIRLAEKLDRESVCRECGAMLPVGDRSDRAYCSDACRVKSYRKRMRAHQAQNP